MKIESNPFIDKPKRRPTQDGLYSEAEVGLANRNSGMLLEFLDQDITPIGAHYLLNHFDVPIINEDEFVLNFIGAFDNSYQLGLAEIRSLPKISMPVTMECAGNGRAGVSPRSHSMPWQYGAVGTSIWTGTLLAPLIEKAKPCNKVVEISFLGADRGFDKGIEHNFGRSLTISQLAELDVLLVYEMNGIPLLPQHGAPLRIIVPGWYGMASVKWLNTIEALTQPFDGHQQVGTYRFKNSDDDSGIPITSIRVKSLMQPPGIPDWQTRKRQIESGSVKLIGKAWSGTGRTITRVEVGINDQWFKAELGEQLDTYAWVKWHYNWHAEPGSYVLRCKATDSKGNVQPLDPPWDVSGFANNAAQKVHVYVR